MKPDKRYVFAEFNLIGLPLPAITVQALPVYALTCT